MTTKGKGFPAGVVVAGAVTAALVLLAPRPEPGLPVPGPGDPYQILPPATDEERGSVLPAEFVPVRAFTRAKLSGL